LLAFNLPVVLVNVLLVVGPLLALLNFVFLWVALRLLWELLRQPQLLDNPVVLILTLVSDYGNFVCRFPLR
jgi:hypothetical protein